jgi:preprotein translocase subunit SecG
MSKVYKIITVIFFITSILIGAQWAHIDELININISNSKKYIPTPSVPK